LRFDVPEVAELQPSGADTLTLVARVGGEEPRATTAAIGDGSSIDLGDLPIEEEIWLSAEMRSAQEQLVGFGQAAGPIQVRAEDRLEATIPVRRPFVYVAGPAGRLMTVDASVASSGGYQGELSVGSAPAVIADVAGTALAAVSGGGVLTYVATSTHEASELPEVELAPPLDAVATPDGAFLLVGHAGRVSVVRVESGDVAPADMPAAADRVAVTRGSDGAWWGVAVLDAATTDTGCSPVTVATFPLDDPGAAAMVDTGLGIADAAGDVMNGTVVLADRCGDRVLRLDPVTGELDSTTPVMTIDAPTAVAAADGRVWAVGHDRETSDDPEQVPDGVVDAWLVLGSADGGGEADVDALEPVVERVLATQVDYPDQDITQDLHANSVSARDLVLLPGAEHLGLIVEVELHGDEYYQGSTVVIPSLEMSTTEYWLVDTSTRLPSQRVRTSCALAEGPCDVFACLLEDWACLPDIDAPIPVLGSFTPTAMTALFGAR
jgi:hypothetical protein